MPKKTLPPHPLKEANEAVASIVDFNALVGKLKFCEEQNRVLRAEINRMPLYEEKAADLACQVKGLATENLQLQKTVATHEKRIQVRILKAIEGLALGF